MLARLVFLIIISVTLMFVDRRFDSLVQARTFLSQFFLPMEFAVGIPSRVVNIGYEAARNRASVVAENEALKAANLRFQAQLQRLKVIESENARLRQLLGSSERLGQNVLISELLSVSLDPFQQKLRIDKGLRHGAFVGQAVIDARGVMGQVTEAAKQSATVLLLSDPNHIIPVEVVRNGLRTVAAGTGKPNRLQLRFLPNRADIHVGDDLVSSGLGGVYPPDYPVAKVIQVRSIPGEAFLEVFAEPTALLDRAREVLLVWEGGQATPSSIAPPTSSALGTEKESPHP